MPYRLAIALSGWVLGLEPRASRATIWRANQLRHTHHKPIAVKLSPAVLSKRPDLFKCCTGKSMVQTCQKGFEPPTHGLEGRCSIQLSYWHKYYTKRVMGIEPTCPAWKAGVLPLNYTRISQYNIFSSRRGDRT